MKEILAKDIMSSPVVSVQTYTILSEVYKILDRYNISGVPVVDEKGKVVGMLSESDLFKYTRFVVGQPIRDLCQLLEKKEEVTRLGNDRGVNMIEAVASFTAGAVMTNKVITIKEDTLALNIVRLINRYNINRIPVVNDKDELVGVISRANILQALEQMLEQ